MKHWKGKPRWQRVETIDSRKYVCGHCGESISSDRGYDAFSSSSSFRVGKIYICHSCYCPTFFDEMDNQFPGAAFGEEVLNINDTSVAEMYRQARDSMKTESYTAAVLCCRKLLMHIAVSKGAASGLKFIEYVEYLSDKNYIPPDAKDWVDHIRQKGNEANHEIKIMPRAEAELLIQFSSMLLQIIYTFPAKIPKKSIPPVNP